MAQLILLSVPLGNLEDMTRRQEKALRQGHTYICEDTRNLIKILQHMGISAEGKTLLSFHDQSVKEELEKLVSEIRRVGTVYLVSDAGSPLISDPGFPLIRACIEQGIEIDTFPGASAPIVALELMGLSPMPFHFHGFFPRENDKREAKGIEISGIKGTHLFFESPYRAAECLENLSTRFPDAKMAIARELTKLYQSTYRFLGRDYKTMKDQIEWRGEFVIGIEIDQPSQDFLPEKKIKDLALEALAKKGRSKDIAKLLAVILNRSTNDLYQELIQK